MISNRGLRPLRHRISELQRETINPNLTDAEQLQLQDSLNRHKQSYHQRSSAGPNEKKSNAVRLSDILPATMAAIRNRMGAVVDV